MAWYDNLDRIFSLPKNITDKCNGASLHNSAIATIPCKRMCVHLVHQTPLFGKSNSAPKVPPISLIKQVLHSGRMVDDHVRGCFDNILTSDAHWNNSALTLILWK